MVEAYAQGARASATRIRYMKRAIRGDRAASPFYPLRYYCCTVPLTAVLKYPTVFITLPSRYPTTPYSTTSLLLSSTTDPPPLPAYPITPVPHPIPPPPLPNNYPQLHTTTPSHHPNPTQPHHTSIPSTHCTTPPHHPQLHNIMSRLHCPIFSHPTPVQVHPTIPLLHYPTTTHQILHATQRTHVPGIAS